MSQLIVQEVAVETVKRGKNSYQVAAVTYTDNGKNFTKKVMSFANPQVFDAVKDLKQNDVIDAEVKKEGEYYNWVKVVKVDANVQAPRAATGVTGGKVLGSNYETAEERKLRQLYIIKQSSIANAIQMLSHGVTEGESLQVTDVLEVAQEFVDFVYGTNETLEEMDSDIPY